MTVRKRFQFTSKFVTFVSYAIECRMLLKALGQKTTCKDDGLH